MDDLSMPCPWMPFCLRSSISSNFTSNPAIRKLFFFCYYLFTCFIFLQPKGFLFGPKVHRNNNPDLFTEQDQDGFTSMQRLATLEYPADVPNNHQLRLVNEKCKQIKKHCIFFMVLLFFRDPAQKVSGHSSGV